MYKINQEKCDGCAACLKICEIGAIYLVDNKAQIDKNFCTECGACVDVCPNNAIILEHAKEQEYPIVADSTPRQPILAAVKSSVVAVGSALLPLLITKVGDIISAKLEKTNRSDSPTKQNTMNYGRMGRRRGKGGGRRQR